MDKTIQERLNEMVVIGYKLSSFGLTRKYEIIEDLYLLINEYIKTGRSMTGVIPFIEGKKKIYYNFINITNKESTIVLKHYDF